MPSRPSSDRRASCAELVGRALLHAREPLNFDELAVRAEPATIRDVAAWLGHAGAAGLIEEVGGGGALSEKVGPESLSQRRFRLRPRGADVLTSARRDSDGVIAA